MHRHVEPSESAALQGGSHKTRTQNRRLQIVIKETAERALQLVASGRENAELSVAKLAPDLADFTVEQMFAFDRGLSEIEQGLTTLRAVLNLASANVVMPTETTK